jgi:V/A-type H+/Na+-transporting ATPase subunit I
MIERMAKVLILGPRPLLPDTLRTLHAQGVLQIRSLPTASDTRFGQGQQGLRKVPLEGGERGAERTLAATAERLQQLLLLLPTPDLITGEVSAPADVTSPAFLPMLAELETDVRTFSDRRSALLTERDVIARYEQLFTALAPLRSALPEGLTMTTLGILVRRDRAEILDLLKREVSRITHGACVLMHRELDREQIGLLLAIPRDVASEVSRFLFDRGITEIRLPERYAGQPLTDALLLLVKRHHELPAEIAEVDAKLLDISRRWHWPLTRALRTVRDQLARLAAMASCGETEYAFVISGWVPAAHRDRVTAALDAVFKGRIIVIEETVSALEYDDVPVVLRNPPYVRAFEPLVGFLALPRYGSIDPTPFMAGFFPLFFGLMLGDIGFGALALVISLLARAKGWGGEIGRKLTTIAVASSVSAIAFGFLFGELFGELGKPLGLHPILFDRRTAALSFLGLTLALGVGHIVLGFGLSLWSALRLRNRKEAMAKATMISLILVALAAGLGHVGYLPSSIELPALLALPLLLAAAILAGGALTPLEVVSTLGNILSYARLMALGTASVMLADVANRMAEVFNPPVVGVTVAVSLHAVNFAMGIFSPTIQALRLHYVEFFDKFFEGGGKPYQPLALTG